MTQQELYDVWTRWMHRNDLTADLDTIYTFAAEKVNERLLFKVVDVADILANSPRMLVHAGLWYLHEMAQDDVGLQREMTLFEDAVVDFSLRTSLNNTNPDMLATEAP